MNFFFSITWFYSYIFYIKICHFLIHLVIIKIGYTKDFQFWWAVKINSKSILIKNWIITLAYKNISKTQHIKEGL